MTALVGAPWNGSSVALDFDNQANVALVDLELLVQGAFVDTGGAAPGALERPAVRSGRCRATTGALAMLALSLCL